MEYLFEESSSDDEDYLNIVEAAEAGVGRRIRGQPTRIKNFLEVTIANSSDREFQQHFRITRQAFEWILEKLTPILEREENPYGRKQIPYDRQLLSTLWLLATSDSYRSVGNRFNMGKSSLFVAFVRVVSALNGISDEIIRWPTRTEREEIADTFRQMAGIPGVIGAIDGTYIPIKAPPGNPEVYINRKCFHALTLQAICLPDLKITDAFTGYPSSVSDIRIFRNSDIYEEISNNHASYFEAGQHIIGDKAYPITNWCIPPYIDRGRLTARQIRFNIAHARTRQVIERSFALLFGRFRRLKYLDMNRIDLIPCTIIACCVLHNICIIKQDNLLNEYINEGLPAVNQEEGVNIIHHMPEERNGNEKRNRLTENF